MYILFNHIVFIFFRVKKRLKKFKFKVQKALMFQKTLPQKLSSSFTALWRTQWHHGFFMTCCRTARCRSTFSRMCSRPFKDFVSSKHRTCRPQQQSSKEEVSGNKSWGKKRTLRLRCRNQMC